MKLAALWKLASERTLQAEMCYDWTIDLQSIQSSSKASGIYWVCFSVLTYTW